MQYNQNMRKLSSLAKFWWSSKLCPVWWNYHTHIFRFNSQTQNWQFHYSCKSLCGSNTTPSFILFHSKQSMIFSITLVATPKCNVVTFSQSKVINSQLSKLFKHRARSMFSHFHTKTTFIRSLRSQGKCKCNSKLKVK